MVQRTTSFFCALALLASPAVSTVPPETQNVVRSPEEAARKTHELVDAGVDVVKTWEGARS